MLYPKNTLAQSILQICKAKNIKNIVISPGSRNAPLIIGFTNDSFFTCYSIVDERSAGFFALGIAQQTSEPVALLCTSGSALLNYYPAFAEAFYSQIPLIILSADRPLDKIDIGDGQTIRQQNVFENHSLYNANLTENASNKNELEICKAIDIAKEEKGPVHINIPFEEPLYDTIFEPTIKVNITNYKPINTNKSANFDDKIWKNSTKKLVIIGSQKPNILNNNSLDILINDPSIVVLTETTSNVYHENFISRIDVLITSFTANDFDNFKPDLLITFGGMIVSKRIKSFLRNYQPKHHWHIDELRAYNTYNCLTKHFIEHPNSFFKRIPHNYISSNYKSNILSIWEEILRKHQLFTSNVPYSDFYVYENIFKLLPNTTHLQIGNSSAIRYAQLFKNKPTFQVFCNRGTSGIDGSTSTAIGAAIINKKPTIFITGDISFFYDSNALCNNYIPKNFKIIIVNNSGGGIFRILPGFQETETFTTYFETSHKRTAKYFAKMYNFGYQTIKNIADFKKTFNKFILQNSQPQILEIFTPEKINDIVLKDYFISLQ